MANKVTTEWFDIQVKYGNFLPEDKQSTLYEENKLMQETHAEENKLENVIYSKNQEQLEEMEDEFDEDDEFTKEFYASRMAELKSKAERIKYGQVIEISRD
jgi:hypothetical protein